MAYDEGLADRARAAVPTDAEVTERKMLGGLGFSPARVASLGAVPDLGRDTAAA